MPHPNIRIQRTHAQHPGFLELIAHLDNELTQRYGEEQKPYDQFNAVQSVDTVVLAIHGTSIVGCGCFKNHGEETAEIKRMYVRPQYRSQGVARQIVTALENWATELGYKWMVLETGDKQPEALALYHKIGYSQIENFGPYKNLPSICFGKAIENNITTP